MAYLWGLLVIMGSHVLGAEDVWLNNKGYEVGTIENFKSIILNMSFYSNLYLCFNFPFYLWIVASG